MDSFINNINPRALDEAINEELREQTERKILEIAKEIKAVYDEYNPDGSYLNISFFGDTLRVNNEFFRKDANKPIYASLDGEEFTSLPFAEIDEDEDEEDEEDD